MKKTTFFIGAVALIFTNIIAANVLKVQSFNKEQTVGIGVENSSQENNFVAVNNEISTNNANNIDPTIFNPNSVVKSDYEKTIENVIVENKLVTETKDVEYQPVCLERTFEDSIVEINQIIESNNYAEVYSLDFEKINQAIQCVKEINNKAIITIDLKL